MLLPLVAIGAAIGSTWRGLPVCTIRNEISRFWPTLGNGTWQRFVFSGPFRNLNVIALALDFRGWHRWDGFPLDRIAGAVFRADGHCRETPGRNLPRPDYKHYRWPISRFYNWSRGIALLAQEAARTREAAGVARL